MSAEVKKEPEPGIDGAEDANVDFSAMKKKKKKPTTGAEIKQEAEAPPPGEEGAEDAGTIQFDQMKKKKKKAKPVGEDGDQTASATAETDDAWPDYAYDELLNRVYNIMREKNPDMVTGEKKKFVMRPPQVLRAGTKKTAFANFADICKLLKRQPKHLLAFLLAELGTSGSIDGNNQLIIKGRFQQKHIENVLRKYIKEYVTCHTCKSAETILQKDTRLFFLQCETCGSRCSVAAIKSGFQAQLGKRTAVKVQ